MANDQMMAQMSKKGGFIAALDQSGGSSPGALRLYGIPDTAYSGDAEMFRLIHQMRVRIMTAPAFTGDKVIGTILFEGTMDGEVRGKPTPSYLWEDRHVVPFVKVDRGLEPEKDGVQLMRPMPQLDQLCERAVKLGVFGTKMRSVINLASKDGIAAIAAQQFEFGEQIAKHGLMPILEPEVSIKSPDKKGAEAILLDELKKRRRRIAGGPSGHVQADPARRPGFVFAARQPPARRPGCGIVRRLYPRGCVQTPRRQSRHHRELLARPRPGSAGHDERRRIRSRPGALDRGNLQRLNRKGVTRTARPVLGPAGAPIAAIDNPRRAPLCAANSRSTPP